MSQVIGATYEGGVFKPDERPALADSARVRLVIEPIDDRDLARFNESWTILQGLWDNSRLNSGGDRLDRDQLHERR